MDAASQNIEVVSLQYNPEFRFKLTEITVKPYVTDAYLYYEITNNTDGSFQILKQVNETEIKANDRIYMTDTTNIEHYVDTHNGLDGIKINYDCNLFFYGLYKHSDDIKFYNLIIHQPKLSKSKKGTKHETCKSVKVNPVHQTQAENLIKGQFQHAKIALAEIEEGQKKTHWAWYIFPTEKVGDSDTVLNSSVQIDTFKFVLDNAPVEWFQTFDAIVKYFEEKGITQKTFEELFPTQLDRGRITPYFFDFWNQPIVKTYIEAEVANGKKEMQYMLNFLNLDEQIKRL